MAAPRSTRARPAAAAACIARVAVTPLRVRRFSIPVYNASAQLLGVAFGERTANGSYYPAYGTCENRCRAQSYAVRAPDRLAITNLAVANVHYPPSQPAAFPEYALATNMVALFGGGGNSPNGLDMRSDERSPDLSFIGPSYCLVLRSCFAAPTLPDCIAAGAGTPGVLRVSSVGLYGDAFFRSFPVQYADSNGDVGFALGAASSLATLATTCANDAYVLALAGAGGASSYGGWTPTWSDAGAGVLMGYTRQVRRGYCGYAGVVHCLALNFVCLDSCQTAAVPVAAAALSPMSRETRTRAIYTGAATNYNVWYRTLARRCSAPPTPRRARPAATWASPLRRTPSPRRRRGGVRTSARSSRTRSASSMLLSQPPHQHFGRRS